LASGTGSVEDAACGGQVIVVVDVTNEGFCVELSAVISLVNVQF
jgi:hypothetical protein